MFDVIVAVLSVRLVALLPDGRYRLAHERWALRLLWLLPVAYWPVWVSGWSVPPALLTLGSGILALVLLTVRYVRLSDRLQQAVRWLAGLTGLAGMAVAAIFPILLPQVGWRPIGPVLPMVLMTVPTALVVIAFRYRIIAIDVLLERSTRYALVWTVTGLGYFGAVIWLTDQVSPDYPGGVVVLIAVGTTFLLLPVRAHFNRMAAYRIFGPRPTRYELLMRLGITVEQAFNLEALAPHLAHSVQEGLELRWARVRLGALDQPERPPITGLAVHADNPPLEETGEHSTDIPLRHGDDILGAIECGPKIEGQFTPADQELLETLARQIALAVHTVRLSAELADRIEQIQHQAAELTASRARIVHAQDSERRRIERHLHDGIQQELVALVAKLRLVRNVLHRDGNQADTLLDEVQHDAYHVIDELRELAHGIHPPELSDQGLVAAVNSRARRLPIPASVIADENLDTIRMTSDIEEAAFFLVSESLTNVLKHAHATHIAIRISHTDGVLRVVVSDNGIGFDPTSTLGSGLTGLRDRVEAVGGHFDITSTRDVGTTVQARLPARKATGD